MRGEEAGVGGGEFAGNEAEVVALEVVQAHGAVGRVTGEGEQRLVREAAQEPPRLLAREPGFSPQAKDDGLGNGSVLGKDGQLAAAIRIRGGKRPQAEAQRLEDAAVRVIQELQVARAERRQEVGPGRSAGDLGTGERERQRDVTALLGDRGGLAGQRLGVDARPLGDQPLRVRGLQDVDVLGAAPSARRMPASRVVTSRRPRSPSTSKAVA